MVREEETNKCTVSLDFRFHRRVATYNLCIVDATSPPPTSWDVDSLTAVIREHAREQPERQQRHRYIPWPEYLRRGARLGHVFWAARCPASQQKRTIYRSLPACRRESYPPGYGRPDLSIRAGRHTAEPRKLPPLVMADSFSSGWPIRIVSTYALSSPPSCATMRTMTSAHLCIVPALQVSYMPTLHSITSRDNTAHPIGDSSLGPRFSTNGSAVVTSPFGAVAPLYMRSRRRNKNNGKSSVRLPSLVESPLVPLNSEFIVLCAAPFLPGFSFYCGFSSLSTSIADPSRPLYQAAIDEIRPAALY
ncbi:hypothetical protein B0H13DRAFT_2537998 [Mycena leptocephala]|nr:hypothetical protein B0H13DRAFT_2537998 [Mycena leptocephala]